MHGGKALGAVLIVLLLPPSVCAQRRGSLVARDAEALKAGKALFAGACSACHGVSGEGGHGPNLTESHEVRRASDEDLFHSIRNGVAGTDMPPFRNPDAQIWQLVAFVHSLNNEEPKAATPPRLDTIEQSPGTIQNKVPGVTK